MQGKCLSISDIIYIYLECSYFHSGHKKYVSAHFYIFPNENSSSVSSCQLLSVYKLFISIC